MERRRYLGACACLAGALAGCASRLDGTGSGSEAGADSGSDADPDSSSGSGAGSGSDPGGGAGDGLPVPESELTRGAPKDAIPAIVDPAFGADWTETVGTELSTEGFEATASTGPLAADDRVIGVVRGGGARAYPLRVLNWHEVVNDSFDGPLLVTYCPLCGSAVTAERRAGGEVTRFGVSGLLYRQDLVMYDEATGSLWSQIEARAIRGELTGERLTLVPSTLTTWGAWRERHPDTRVLLPPPASGTLAEDGGVREYDRNPYGFYDDSKDIGIGGSYEGPLHPKTVVIGVTHGGEARAYPFDRVREAGVVNDAVGGRPVVVAAAEDTLAAYVRRVDGETVRFARDGEHLRAAGSRWTVLGGEALDGPHEGARLRPANDTSPLFYFAWQKFNPDTDIWGGGGSGGERTAGGG